MRDDELRRLLQDANPWWRAASDGTDPTLWAGHDRLLVDRARYDLGYRSDILDDIAQGPVGDSLVLLRGPRRVGKSVVLRDVAIALCRRPELDPRQIIHVPCDGFAARDLGRALVLSRDLTKAADDASARPRVWLLDEVGGLRGWTPILKRARDLTPFGDETVVITSSSWNPDENVVGNLLAGRAGSRAHRRQRLLLPMSFRDFLAATRPEVPFLKPAHPAHLQSDSLRGDLEALTVWLDQYDLAWQAYLSCGGFPRAVFEHAKHGAVSRSYLEDIAAWLSHDVDPDAAEESIPQLLAALTARSTSPLNRTKVSHDLAYSGRAQFDLRLNRLVHSFAAIWCPQRDDRGNVVPNTQSKLYLVDPAMAWLPPELRSGLPWPDFTTLTEQTLAIASARAADALQDGRWIRGDTIGYARTGSGNEIDLAPMMLPTPTGTEPTVPLESKWVEHRWRSEARAIENKYGAGVVATKSILDLSHPAWAVPAPLVALLLN